MDTNSDELIADILIVDDKLENIRFLSDFLSTQKYQVRKAINGQSALRAARSLPPDLILLDINMPGMGGYEVCEQLKQDPATSEIPIVFLSAGNEVSDKVQAFQVGGADYITKPFQLEEILAKLQTHLKVKSLQKTLEIRNQELQQTIATLQQTRAALAASEAELRALLNSMTELILIFDGEGKYLKVANTNTKLLYKPNEERIGRHLSEILPQPQAEILLNGIQQALQTNQNIEVEYSLILDPGNTELRANISPILPNTVLCVVRDISERKQQEEA